MVISFEHISLGGIIMTGHEPCATFGWGFDGEHELCKYCIKALECMRETDKTKIAISSGQKPNIPFAPEKQALQIWFEKPKIMDGKVNIAFRIDVEWLKKQIGWDKKDGSETKP